MFGKRSDGRIVKVDPYSKMSPHIMSKRSDALNYAKVQVRCEPIDEFVRQRREEDGIHFTYLDILIACMVRLMALRKHLNRFVNAGRIYQRDYIDISFVVKKTLREAESIATAVKIRFTGAETIYEVKQKVDEVIAANSGLNTENNLDKTAGLIAKAPNFAMRFIWWLLKKLDKWNHLPKSLIQTSCFHTSCFITNMKSIKGDYIYHHCYDFGTTGIFFAMGKEHMEAVVENGEVVPGKVLTMGVVTDERFCDGMYYSISTRVLKKLFADLNELRTPYSDEIVDRLVKEQAELKEKERIKAEKKAKKAKK